MSGIDDIDINMFKDLTPKELERVIKKFKYRMFDLMRVYEDKLSGKDLEYTKARDGYSTNLKIICRNILCRLEQSKPHHNKDVEILSELVMDEFNLSSKKTNHKYELISASIVFAVLDYYNVQYDKYDIFKYYNISLDDYFDFGRRIARWCKDNYWK